jgi:hypothetical protein
VLRELMSHRKLETTSGYYRIGETRRREAVDRVTAMQFDRHGNRIWRHAQALLDSEHARHAVGQVAVPFGVCAEPSNVKAGGGACPFRFRCAGCDHFRTDVSYLPDLLSGCGHQRDDLGLGVQVRDRAGHAAGYQSGWRHLRERGRWRAASRRTRAPRACASAASSRSRPPATAPIRARRRR